MSKNSKQKIIKKICYFNPYAQCTSLRDVNGVMLVFFQARPNILIELHTKNLDANKLRKLNVFGNVSNKLLKKIDILSRTSKLKH